MPRYDDPYHDRHAYERAVLRPGWGREHPSDPNWRDGHYHGLRSAGTSRQAPYGLHRRDRHRDLGGWGGFEGRYRRLAGGFRRDGLLAYSDRRREGPAPGRAWRYDEAFEGMGEGWQGGGVREDVGYLRQYNSRSPELRYGRDFQRAAGWAERGRYGNPYPVDEPTHEREYGGYNAAGWAPGTRQGPGSRAWRPRR